MKCIYLLDSMIREVQQFKKLSFYLCFLEEKMVFQIFHCVYDHKFYSISVNDIAKKRKF